MSPPLRQKAHRSSLWRGLRFDDLQVVSTDHCPFCMKEQKELGRNDFSKIPNGAPGIETRMSLVYDGGVRAGRISLNRFVRADVHLARRRSSVSSREGHHRSGLGRRHRGVRPRKKHTLSAKTLHMKVDYNPYEGREVTGATDTVLSRGSS